jgi:hypothetical protein
MFASYGENSGFSPVAGEELTTVNGGIDPILLFLLGVAATAIAGCAQPTNSDELNQSAQFGGNGKRS